MEKRSTNQKEKAVLIEKQITDQLKQIGDAIHVNSDYDILFNNIPIEVKSSELCLFSGVTCKDSKTVRYRRPFFKIIRCNHWELVAKNGYYCFVITFNEKIILELFLPAKNLTPRNKLNFYYVASDFLYDDNMLSFDEFKKTVLKQDE